MKKYPIILFSFCFFTVLLSAQKLHSTAELFKIMEKSETSYQLNFLEKEIPAPDRSNNLNYNHCFRVSENNVLMTKKYEPNFETQACVKKAEDYFSQNQFSEARDMYLKALAINPTYYELMTYVGQTYGIEKNYDKAIEWYKKTIQLNYIDYLAHWFLADIYKIKGDNEKALDEITIALILNRNNPRLINAFNSIYELNKIKLVDWTFNPQIQIDSISPKEVKISANSDWLGYAMTKALWLYEPGYAASMGVKENTYSTLQERECISSLFAGIDKVNLKKNPDLKALKTSLDKDMFDEFLFFEVILPEYPYIAYQLTEDFILKIKDYIKTIRYNTK